MTSTDNRDLIKFYGTLREHGWIWGPEPDMYEPINGHYTYGIMGASLKNELEKYIRSIYNSNDFFEIKTPLIYPKTVWMNSGHWNKFQDPVISTTSGSVYRLDKLIEEQFKVMYGDLSESQIKEYRSKLQPPNVNDPFVFGEHIDYKNLMMTTHSGSVLCGLRPETATTTYTSFDNAYTHFGKKLPFGLYQIGFAFRNEPNPRQNILRCREFTQAEAQLFIDPQDKNTCPDFDYVCQETIPVLKDSTIQFISLQQCLDDKLFQTKRYAYLVYIAYKLFEGILPKHKIRLRQHAENERAFYALDAWDIEINISNIGWTECAGIHDRGDYDLTQHPCKLQTKPHILELAIGVDRTVFALLDTYIDKKSTDIGKSSFSIPHFLAPFKVSVLPLVKNKSELVSKAIQIHKLLKSKFTCLYDDHQSIGKRYLKASMKGVPYCVTVDYQTLSDNTVTVRHRDTESQERLHIDSLLSWLSSRV